MTTTITNRPDRLVIKNPPSDNTAFWAIQAYSFLIPYYKTFTAADLANLIPEYYDAEDQHTAEAIKALKAL